MRSECCEEVEQRLGYGWVVAVGRSPVGTPGRGVTTRSHPSASVTVDVQTFLTFFSHRHVFYVFIPPYGSMVGMYSLLLCLCLYDYGFLSGGQRQRRETSHASSTTIRDELLPFW